MTARCSHLEGTFYGVLALDIGKVVAHGGLGGIELLTRVDNGGLKG